MEAAEFFATLSDKEIRKRQDLCNIQIAEAHRTQNETALARLRIMERNLTDAMLARC